MLLKGLFIFSFAVVYCRRANGKESGEGKEMSFYTNNIIKLLSYNFKENIDLPPYFQFI